MQETILVQRCLEGDQLAWHTLQDHYGGLVHRAVCRLVGPRAAAGLVVEEITARVWVGLFDRNCRRLRAFDPRRGPLAHYLVALARAEVRGERRRRRKVHVSLRDWELVETNASGDTMRLIFDEYLSTLPAKQKRFFERHLLQRAPENGAENLSAACIWKRKERSYKSLRAFLQCA